jgi:hypothetical protein
LREIEEFSVCKTFGESAIPERKSNIKKLSMIKRDAIYYDISVSNATE